MRVTFSSCSVDNDEHDPARDRPDSNEAVFLVGVSVVEDLEVVEGGDEQLLGLFEGHPVLLLVGEILGLVPLDPHRRKYTPMAY